MTELQLDAETLEVYEYLDNLRESGVTNMFAAPPYIELEFGVEEGEASRLLSGWMETFAERHPQ